MTGVLNFKITPLKLSGKINKLYVTSDFGERNSGFHHGIDLVGYDGTLRKVDIIAPADGKVTKNYWSDACGWCVHIKHDNAVTRYYHLAEKSLLCVGQNIKCGDTVGKMGNTGSTSAGNHLHFEVRDGSDGLAIDPKGYLTGKYKLNKAVENMAEFKNGDSNNGVFAVKIALRELRRRGVIPQGCDPNGVFGMGTEVGVKAVQKLAGLKQTGVVDTATLQALDTLLSEQWNKDGINNANAVKKADEAGAKRGMQKASAAYKKQIELLKQQINALGGK